MARFSLTVNLHKPRLQRAISYAGTLLEEHPPTAPTYRLVRAVWDLGRMNVGPLVFVPGDVLLEHYYTDRWYNVFALYTAAGVLKGWYCNLTRPACFAANRIESEDLELDLCVSPDRRTLELLDEEEYAARNLEQHEPVAHEAVQAALIDLRSRAMRGAAPFVAHPLALVLGAPA